MDLLKEKHLESNSTQQYTKSSLNQLYREATEGLNINWRFAELFKHSNSSSWIYRGDISSRYNSQALRFYLKRYQEKLNKAWIVEPKNIFANMAKLCADSGLARTGRNIPIECLVQLVTVKDLNVILNATHKRRGEATQDLLSRPEPYMLLESLIDLELCYEFFVVFDESDVNSYLRAWNWAETASELMRNAVEGGINSDSRWTKSEYVFPNLPDNITKNLIETYRDKVALQQASREEFKSKWDPIYGGNPEVILTPKNESDLNRLEYWSYWLEIMLDSPRVKESKYQDVLNKIANHVILLIPTVKEELRLSSEKLAKFQTNEGPIDEGALNVATYQNSSVLWSINNNKALTKYVKYLSAENQFEKAIEICEICISYGIHNGTKGGFGQRLESLIKTNKKLKESKQPRKNSGKVSLAQIAEIQKRYPTCSSLDRQKLAQEFGLTMTHLYYILSKNK